MKIAKWLTGLGTLATAVVCLVLAFCDRLFYPINIVVGVLLAGFLVAYVALSTYRQDAAADFSET